MNSPLISVVMPAYNVAKYIAESIDSVINQSYTDWELIIVDDGSSDGTAAIIKEYANRDNRILYLYQKNQGQAVARNTALAKARGEYVAFLDADDIWISIKLSLQLEILRSKKADLVFSGTYHFYKKLDTTKKMKIMPGVYKGKEGVIDFFMRYYIPLSSVIVIREAMDKVQGFETDRSILVAEDHDLFTRILIEGFTILGIPDLLVYSRLHSESSSYNDRHLIFQQLSSLQSIAKKYPYYKSKAGEAFLYRIEACLYQVNINDWEKIKRLLTIRNKVIKNKSFILYYKMIHALLTSRGFRVLFKWKVKIFKSEFTYCDFEKLSLS